MNDPELHHAVRTDNLDEIEQSLAIGVDVNDQNSRGYTHLHLAAVMGYLEVVRRLLAGPTIVGTGGPTIVGTGGPVNVNAQDNYGRTPLHWAVVNGYSEIVKLLLTTSTITEATRQYGNDTVVASGTRAESSVNVNVKDNFGRTPLHYAVRVGHSEIIKLLLTGSPADINIQDNLGNTPIYYANAFDKPLLVSFFGKNIKSATTTRRQ